MLKEPPVIEVPREHQVLRADLALPDPVVKVAKMARMDQVERVVKQVS